jgi:hypothetical protein
MTDDSSSASPDETASNALEITINPSDFIIPSSDAHGHSERLFIRIQPGHDRQLSTVLASKYFPYRSKADIVKHAIIRHLKWLETLAAIPSVTAQVDAIIEIVREAEFQSEFDETFARVDSQVSTHITNGRLPRARALIAQVISKIDLMPDGDWKEIYRQRLLDRYGNMLDGKPVDLTEMED